MDQMKRYAIYYAPREGAFAEAAAAWLGWDMPRGQEVAQALPAALVKLTDDPRKYGFHGTLKAPFRLTEGLELQDLTQGLRALAGQLAPLRMAGLELSDRHGFLALTPLGAQDQLQALASEVVRALEPYRAALTPAEYARRRPESLSHRQRELLDTYGYPFVMEEFQFHLTLSGALTPPQAEALIPAARALFTGLIPQPFEVQDLCLCGEDAMGRFHLLHRYALSA